MTRDFRLTESDAADVAQATWLRLFEHMTGCEYPARVGSWLAVTARRECLRHVAARKRVVLVHDDGDLHDVVAHGRRSMSACSPTARAAVREAPVGPARAVAADAPAAHGRSAGVLR